MQKIYTAFDETNHGRYPEIFVMVSTTDKKYTKEYYEEKGKRTIRWTTERLVKFLYIKYKGLGFLGPNPMCCYSGNTYIP